jgi:hypothetical protein
MPNLPNHKEFMVSALVLKQPGHWRCDSCLLDFPEKIESIIISTVVDDRVKLCPPCGRHLGRDLMRTSSTDRKTTTRVHRGNH